MDLHDLAEDTQYCIRGLGKPVRRCEDDCSAALVSNCPRSQEKIHHTHFHRFDVAATRRGTLLLLDNAVHNLGAHDNDSSGNMGPAHGSVLCQVEQMLMVVGLDSEDRCEGVVLPL